jgi:arylsulfatase A-like enzyme
MKINISTLAILVAGICTGNLSAKDNSQNIKWNILVLMTDMQSAHYLGCDHQSRENISTPNLDKLGKEGMIFRKAYDAFPVCAPTRASLLTGCYPMKHGQFGNSDYLTEAGPQGKTPSLAHLFRNTFYF